jgi:hypothetical protein
MTTRTPQEAKIALYETYRDGHERRARRALEELRRELTVLTRRMDSAPGSLDRQIVADSARKAAEIAATLAVETGAWAGLLEAAPLTEEEK